MKEKEERIYSGGPPLADTQELLRDVKLPEGEGFDLETILAEYLYYEGDLWEYLGHVPENDDEFMTKLGYWRATKATLQLMGALIRRKASAHRQSRWTL